MHYQFILVVAEAFLEEKIACFASLKYGISDFKNFASILKQKSEPEVFEFLDALIEDSSHTVFFTDETLEKISSDYNDGLPDMEDYFVTLCCC